MCKKLVINHFQNSQKEGVKANSKSCTRKEKKYPLDKTLETIECNYKSSKNLFASQKRQVKQKEQRKKYQSKPYI